MTVSYRSVSSEIVSVGEVSASKIDLDNLEGSIGFAQCSGRNVAN